MSLRKASAECSIPSGVCAEPRHPVCKPRTLDGQSIVGKTDINLRHLGMVTLSFTD